MADSAAPASHPPPRPARAAAATRAAAVAAVVAAAGVVVEIQVAVFLVCTVASLAFIRPIAKRHLRTPARLRTGTAALVGTQALVLERVDRDCGQVKIGGEVWTA